MKLFYKRKDGGVESSVTGYWLIESKRFFSIVLLKFEGKSREAFHTHAFNSVSWLVKGALYETHKHGRFIDLWLPSIKPIITTRNRYHKVDSDGTSWVLSFRGKWNPFWKEFTNKDGEYSLANGRKKV